MLYLLYSHYKGWCFLRVLCTNCLSYTTGSTCLACNKSVALIGKKEGLLGRQVSYWPYRRIGGGGFGVTLAAAKTYSYNNPPKEATCKLVVKLPLLEDASLGTEVAASLNKDACSILRDEIEILKILRRRLGEVGYPAYIDDIEFWNHKAQISVPALVTSYAGHTTLNELITRSGKDGLSGKTIVKLVTNVAAFLAYLHNMGGYSHGDIHPGNIVLNEDGNFCVIDFGLSRRLDYPIGDKHGAFCYAHQHQLDDGLQEQYTDLYSLSSVAGHCMLGNIFRDAPPLLGQEQGYFANWFEMVRTIRNRRCRATLPEGHLSLLESIKSFSDIPLITSSAVFLEEWLLENERAFNWIAPDEIYDLLRRAFGRRPKISRG
jgi:serine/threonine protein kinase